MCFLAVLLSQTPLSLSLLASYNTTMLYKCFSKFFRFKQSLHFTKEFATKSDEILPGLDPNLHLRHRSTKPRSRSHDSTEKSKRNSFIEDERSPSKKQNNEESKIGSVKKNHSNMEIRNRLNVEDEKETRMEVKLEPCEAPFIKQEPLDYRETTEDDEMPEMVVDSQNEQVNHSKFTGIFQDGDSNSSSNSAPFIPPAASGNFPLSIAKPPSEIFLQELDKFIKTTLKGGCLCLAEFKEVLQLRQQGMMHSFFLLCFP